MLDSSPQWRDTTSSERELIETILLADFSGREEIAQQLRGARVRDDCACGCGSFAVQPTTDSARTRTSGVVFEAEGKDEADNLVGLFVMVRDGLVEYIECWGMATNAASLPRPDTLKLTTAIQRSPTWSTTETHRRTIVEEATARRESES